MAQQGQRQQPQHQSWMPAIPTETTQEGARWRHHKPSSEHVASWWATVPLDEEMEERREKYVSGIVLIPATEKVRYRNPETGQTGERFEDTWTPYPRVDVRVRYFRELARARDLIAVIEPVDVPRVDDTQSAYYNGNLGRGLFWHLVRGEGSTTVRYLCSQWRIAMYVREEWAIERMGRAEGTPGKGTPELEAIGTKQSSGGSDNNAIMKAETGAVGRALGLGGILVVGTGIATAEDMQESMTAQSQGAAPEPTLPPAAAPNTGEPQAEPQDPEARDEALREEMRAWQAEMQTRFPEAWHEYARWWGERGLPGLGEVRAEVLRGAYTKLQRDLDTARASTAVVAPTD